MAEYGYFSHDLNARNDRKIIALRMQHGMEGVGIYWSIVEMLYEEGGFAMRTECERIAFELRSDVKRIASVIHDFGLFTFDDEKFWSESVNRRMEMRKDKSVKASESAKKRWDNANGMRTHSEGNAKKERKVKESKEDKTPIPPLHTDAVSPEEKPEPPPDPPGGRLTPFVTEFKSVYPNKDGLHHAEMAFVRAVVDDNADPELLVKKAKQYAWLIEKTDPTQKMFKAKNWLERKEYLNDYGQLWKDFKAKKAAEGDDEKPFYKPILNQ